MRVNPLFFILLLLAALAPGVFVLPQVASVWFLNLANASVARAQSLPLDSPQRIMQLDQAKVDVARARGIACVPRNALAEARVSLLRGDAAQAQNAFDSSSLLPVDAISELVWGESAYQANQPDVAFAHWRAAGAVEFFMQEARRDQAAEEWSQAERMARIAVGIEPTRADGHYLLGDALTSQLSTNPEALRELDQALALSNDPEFKSMVLSRKGEWYSSQGKLPEALALFAQARTIAPIDARPRTDYAVTLWHLSPGARPEATVLLKQVTEDSPWYIGAYVALANLAAGDGDLRGAEVWLQTGLARNPNNPGLLVPLARLYEREQRTDQARQTLILALKNEARPHALRDIASRLEKLSAP